MRERYADLARMEDVLRASDLDWTIFRPPRLTNGRLTGAYRTAVGRNLRGGALISRADVAHAMLAAVGAARDEAAGGGDRAIVTRRRLRVRSARRRSAAIAFNGSRIAPGPSRRPHAAARR